MAETLIGSEIIKIAGDINEMISKGIKICNLTIGDFNPKYFPIPKQLLQEIIDSYKAGNTNYPAANGMAVLREAVSGFLKKKQGLSYTPDEILISAGSRPLITGAYMALVDPGDNVVFPVPSWNNNHYSHIVGANPIVIETLPEKNFMPTAQELEPYLENATLLALCSPLNPTGTVFSKKGLSDICELVLAINKRRSKSSKPLYILYDQVYWQLTYGNTVHYDPVTLCPELRDYVIYIDGMSKAFAATGVRVGWAMGPTHIINKMKAILSHVGAWSPKAEQMATAKYLCNFNDIGIFLDDFKKKIENRLNLLYNGFSLLKTDGLKVDAISPTAAIYLTAKLDLCGTKTSKGDCLTSNRDVAKYILEEAQIAIVPFYAFGASESNSWYRLSVGACTEQEINEAFPKLRKAIEQLFYADKTFEEVRK